jgi:hypothetical protein
MKQFPENVVSWVKAGAFVAMLVDHVGVMFFPEVSVLRLVGRFALPWFALLVGVGSLHWTRDSAGYMSRLLILGLISQPVYQWAFQVHHANVLITLAIGAAVVVSGLRLAWVVVVGLCLWWCDHFHGFAWMDGASGTVLLVVLCAYRRWWWASLVAGMVNLSGDAWGLRVLVASSALPLAIAFGYVSALEPFRGGSLPGDRGGRGAGLRSGLSVSSFMRSRWWYFFYPGHLFALCLLRALASF